jgi:hypothetical protein
VLAAWIRLTLVHVTASVPKADLRQCCSRVIISVEKLVPAGLEGLAIDHNVVFIKVIHGVVARDLRVGAIGAISGFSS